MAWPLSENSCVVDVVSKTGGSLSDLRGEYLKESRDVR